MKGLLKGVAAFGLVATLGATTAHAQNLITFGAGGGVAIPLSNFSDAFKTGWDAGAVFQFKPASSPVGLQIDGTYQENKSKTVTGVKSQLIYGTANVVYWLPVAKETKIRPYLLGGGGVYNAKTKGSGTSLPSETKFGINAGAGFDINFGQSLALFVDGRFHNVFVSGSDTKFIPINAGIRWHTM